MCIACARLDTCFTDMCVGGALLLRIQVAVEKLRGELLGSPQTVTSAFIYYHLKYYCFTSECALLQCCCGRNRVRQQQCLSF